MWSVPSFSTTTVSGLSAGPSALCALGSCTLSVFATIAVAATIMMITSTRQTSTSGVMLISAIAAPRRPWNFIVPAISGLRVLGAHRAVLRPVARARRDRRAAAARTLQVREHDVLDRADVLLDLARLLRVDVERDDRG